MKNPELLLKTCQEGVAKPEFQPTTDKATGKLITHCNAFADFVAQGFGCEDFRDHLNAPIRADSIYLVMKDRGDRWRYITSGGTWTLADQGSLVFGILPSYKLNQEHGHIIIVIPGKPDYSSHWNSLAPIAANVGSENWIGKKASFAFRTEPEWYAFIPSL